MNCASLSKIYISTQLISEQKSKPLEYALQNKSLIPEEATILLTKDEQKGIPNLVPIYQQLTF